MEEPFEPRNIVGLFFCSVGLLRFNSYWRGKKVPFSTNMMHQHWISSNLNEAGTDQHPSLL